MNPRKNSKSDDRLRGPAGVSDGVVLLQERVTQMITIRFVAGNDLISSGIRLAEYGFWATHVETLMPDGTLLGAHARDGVQARPRNYDRGKFSKEEFVHIPATSEQTDGFHTFLRAQIGRPYDFKAILGIVMQRDWRNDKAWMCGELVTAGFCQEKVGIFPPHLATEFSRVTPRDLLLIVSGHYKLAARRRDGLHLLPHKAKPPLGNIPPMMVMRGIL